MCIPRSPRACTGAPMQPGSHSRIHYTFPPSIDSPPPPSYLIMPPSCCSVILSFTTYVWSYSITKSHHHYPTTPLAGGNPPPPPPRGPRKEGTKNVTPNEFFNRSEHPTENHRIVF